MSVFRPIAVADKGHVLPAPFSKLRFFAVGLGAVIFGIGAALWDAQASRKALNESFSIGVLVMFIMLPMGFLFMIFAFGAQAENWTGVLQSVSQILLKVRPA